MQPYAIFGLGPLEIVIIVAVVVVLFLPALLPKIVKRVAETMVTIKDMANKGLDAEETENKDKKKEKKGD
jgi:Sec-independent protein translocase protein TatA